MNSLLKCILYIFSLHDSLHKYLLVCILPEQVNKERTVHSAQFSGSVMSNSLWPLDCNMPGYLVHHQLMELAHSCPSSWWCLPTISSCCPLLLLPSIFPSIRDFSNRSALSVMWPKCWSATFSIRPSNKYSGLISFTIDWFDLLAVQGALKSLLQEDSSKASIIQHLAFFVVQLSHPYITTGKTIALSIWTFDSK